jgi:hypothetical protein
MLMLLMLLMLLRAVGCCLEVGDSRVVLGRFDGSTWSVRVPREKREKREKSDKTETSEESEAVNANISQIYHQCQNFSIFQKKIHTTNCIDIIY